MLLAAPISTSALSIVPFTAILKQGRRSVAASSFPRGERTAHHPPYLCHPPFCPWSLVVGVATIVGVVGVVAPIIVVGTTVGIVGPTVGVAGPTVGVVGPTVGVVGPTAVPGRISVGVGHHTPNMRGVGVSPAPSIAEAVEPRLPRQTSR